MELIKVITVLMVLVIPASATGAAPCLPWRVGAPEGNYIVPGSLGSITYRQIGAQPLKLDAYLQPGQVERPAVIVIHGGGWTSGSRVAFVGQFFAPLTRAGYHWFVIDYRLEGVGQAAKSLSDLRAAVEFIRCHASKLRVDAQRIILLGEDTGAVMAAVLASDPTSSIRAQVLIGGKYPLPPQAQTTQMPSTLVIHGTDDGEVKPGLAVELCREIGDRCRYLAIPGASHRPENWWPVHWGYKMELINWLNQQCDAKRWASQVKSEPQTNQSARLHKDIVYDAALELKLDAWLPGGRKRSPAVILVHGGGWEAGDKETYLTPLLRPLAEAGFAWFSIDYRLTPKFDHSAQLVDLRTAIKFVHRNADRFGIDPRRIAILGESAGGQMVSLVGTEKMPEVAAVVSLYGVYDLLAMATRLDARSIPGRLFGISTLDEPSRHKLIDHSPVYRVQPGMKPILLICGTADGLFLQHQAMATRLAEARVRFETVELTGAPHGMENWEGHPNWTHYQQRLVDWLQRSLDTAAK